MINLMYLVFIAMMALNVSSEVLDGFELVEGSLRTSIDNSSRRNSMVASEMEAAYQQNPQKVGEWAMKSRQVKQASDSLYNYIQELKLRIVRQADGEQADVDHIENKDDLEAASTIMLSALSGEGKKLRETIDQYRTQMSGFMQDTARMAVLEATLSTVPPRKSGINTRSWEEALFEGMPAAAAVTLLTKLQSDVRYAEGEVLHTLVSNIDMKDIRVNKLSAFVIPESRTVISGDQFAAQIVMAAVDTTQQPEIYVGGQRVNNGLYRFTAGAVGEHQFGGYITMRDGAGNVIRRDFTQKYTVVAPSATVSADLMNVLYAGYDNPISVSIPGVPLNAVQASMSGGSFRSIGMGRYIARPSAVGSDVTISVASNDNGKSRQMGKFTFHVRKLPDPAAYISVGTDRFRGGGLSKASLMDVQGIKAAIDDGILDIQFKVVSFEAVFFDNMGNAVPMASNGANFSDRQRGTFRKLSRGKRFYISRIKAVGPDGITRQLAGSMEVIVK